MKSNYLEKGSSSNNGNIAEAAQIEQVLVTADEISGARGYGAGKEFVV